MHIYQTISAIDCLERPQQTKNHRK